MAVWAIVKKSETQKTARLDAEYYQPKYFTLLNQLRQSGLPLNRLSNLITERVHRGTLPEYTEHHEIPVIKTGVVRNDFLLFDSCAYTTEDFYEHNPRGVVKPLDILMTSTGRGTLGRVNIFNENFKAYADGHISIIRTSKVEPYYTYTFLVSKYGQFQAEMAYAGSTGQIEIYPDHIEAFTIPIPSAEHEKYIRRLASEAHSLKRQSERLYLQAEQMLLAELSLDKLDFSQPNYYSIPLSQAQGRHRVDAEHFQPKYDKLIQHLSKAGKTKLHGEIATYIKRGLQPTYVEDGEIIVVNSQHLGQYLLNVEATERTDHDFWERNKRARLEKDDILVYSTGAYVGRTNVWLEDQKGIASNHVTIIRNLKGCNPLYLAVYLNALPGLLQAEKWSTGSGQRELYTAPIANFYIYLPSEDFQTKIANLVIQSYEARKEAKSLLEEAKKEVEDFIEKGGLEKTEIKRKDTLPLLIPKPGKPTKPPVQVKYKIYPMLDGLEMKLVQQMGDGSIIKRFEKTSIPKKKTDVVCPHFLELKWATGCPYDCAWCYLKGTFRFLPYKTKPHIKDFDKVEKHTRTFLEYVQTPEILNTGELADSLMLEGNKKSFVNFIVPLFENQNRHKILLVTKSNKIENLLKLSSHHQVIASFSLNAIPIAQKWEKKAPPIEDRIKAAKILYEQGHEVRIRIDPMVPVEDWEELYNNLIDLIFGSLFPERITIGSLRGLQSTINGTSDKSWVKYLSEYSNWGKKIDINLRLAMYQKIITYLKEKHKYHKVALCKETVAVWDILKLDYKNIKCNCIW